MSGFVSRKQRLMSPTRSSVICESGMETLSAATMRGPLQSGIAMQNTASRASAVSYAKPSFR